MAQLRQDYSKFQALNTEVVVVGPENAAAFRAYFEANKLAFVGLPNPDHSVLKRFGQQVSLFKLGRMPAQVLVDQQGIARYAHYGNAMSDIPETEEMLAIIAEVNAEYASA